VKHQEERETGRLHLDMSLLEEEEPEERRRVARMASWQNLENGIRSRLEGRRSRAPCQALPPFLELVY
jgi:hypothetical protein